MQITRRKLLFGGVAGALALLATNRFGGMLWLGDDLLDYIPDDLKVPRLGKAIAEYPGLDWAPSLVERELKKKLPLYAYASKDAMRDALGKIVREDYAEQKLVVVNGWVLPITAAYIAVLAYEGQYVH